MTQSSRAGSFVSIPALAPPLIFLARLAGKVCTKIFGLTHGIVSREQYTHLVAVVLGSAAFPAMIASAVFLPRHLLPATMADKRRNEDRDVDPVGAIRPEEPPEES